MGTYDQLFLSLELYLAQELYLAHSIVQCFAGFYWLGWRTPHTASITCSERITGEENAHAREKQEKAPGSTGLDKEGEGEELSGREGVQGQKLGRSESIV